MLSLKDFLAILHDLLSSLNVIEYIHYVKSVQVQSYSSPYFHVFGPEITPYLDTFDIVIVIVTEYIVITESAAQMFFEKRCILGT